MTTRDRLLDAAQELVLQRGFTGTTVDALLAAAGVSKGAFFHHFPSKTDLGVALVERYARQDLEILESHMKAVEEATDDPAEQLVEFLRRFEQAASAGPLAVPGCLFVPFVYEEVPERVNEVVIESIGAWRQRLVAKLEAAAAERPLSAEVDLPSLADQVFTIFEGGFVLARATREPERLVDQLRHLRTYLSLLFGGSTEKSA